MNKPKNTEKLIPPDLSQCQAEIREGSFMTLGPRPMVRCTKAPIYVGYEPKVLGRAQGSMSLCGDCAAVAVKQIPGVTLKPISKRKPRLK